MNAQPVIEFGTPSNNDALSVRFGIAHGVFEQLGLDLRIRTVFGGPELAAAFASGEIPLGSLGSPSGLPAIAAGAGFSIAGSGCRQGAQMYLGVRRDITGYDGLRGKRIGLLSIGSCPSWILSRMLRQHGLDPDADVDMTPLHADYPRVLELMADGRIDACMATEPNLSIGEHNGLLDVWAAAWEAPYLPRFQWIVRVANTDFIERHPERVADVLTGCRRAARLAVERREAFVDFVADYYRASRSAVDRAMSRELPRYQVDGELDMAGLQVACDLLYDLGGLAEPTRAERLVDARFQRG